MAALEVIQLYRVIIHIVTVAEGIVFAQIILAAAGDRNNLAPGIVLIAYYLRMPACQNANDIALQVVLIEEASVIQLNMRRFAIRIVVEVNLIGFRIRFTAHLGVTRDVNKLIAIPEAGEELCVVLTILFIIHGVHTFVQPAKGIIAKGYFFVSCSTRSTLRRLGKQVVVAVRIRPAIDFLDVGAGISDGCALVGSKLIAPVGSAVGESFSALDRTQRTGGIGVILLAEDVAAAVVIIYPGGTGRVGGSIGRIVYSGHVKKGMAKPPRELRSLLLGEKKLLQVSNSNAPCKPMIDVVNNSIAMPRFSKQALRF